MARQKTWHIGKLNALVADADAAIDPLLSSAKVLTIRVEGQDIPASDAPLADKIRAYSALCAPGLASQDLSELTVTNDQLARQIESVSAENTRLSAGNAAMTQEIAQLKNDLAAQKASVASLTASQTELKVRHEAALSQLAGQTALVNAFNAELSRVCIAGNCIELRDERNNPLAADATPEQKQAAADRIPVADKLKAYQGAVNAAMGRTGVSANAIPTGAPLSLGTSTILNQLDAIQDPTARAVFFKKNKAAIHEARRALKP